MGMCFWTVGQSKFASPKKVVTLVYNIIIYNDLVHELKLFNAYFSIF